MSETQELKPCPDDFCPFCGESGFDLSGLKTHLVNEDCPEYRNTETINRLFATRADSAELTQLRAERDTWRENWNTASKELADLHDQLAEARKDSERIEWLADRIYFPEDHPEGGIFVCIGSDALPVGAITLNKREDRKAMRAAIDAAKGAGK